MTEHSQEYWDFIEQVDGGSFTTEELRNLNTYIIETLKDQRTQLARKVKMSLKIGDKVKLQGLKPARLNGLEVEVEKINRTTIVASVPGYGSKITIPMTCIERV